MHQEGSHNCRMSLKAPSPVSYYYIFILLHMQHKPNRYLNISLLVKIYLYFGSHSLKVSSFLKVDTYHVIKFPTEKFLTVN